MRWPQCSTTSRQSRQSWTSGEKKPRVLFLVSLVPGDRLRPQALLTRWGWQTGDIERDLDHTWADSSKLDEWSMAEICAMERQWKMLAPMTCGPCQGRCAGPRLRAPGAVSEERRTDELIERLIPIGTMTAWSGWSAADAVETRDYCVVTETWEYRLAYECIKYP